MLFSEGKYYYLDVVFMWIYSLSLDSLHYFPLFFFWQNFYMLSRFVTRATIILRI